ncbi:hypothetical protein PISMIDRAFT_671533 [Pisolithus microcarpus 441]|uniref:Uncharacterized protein n=1 Tax=Pisolithus microcarpus 441 TaxID=765257 RepID=A0A0C9ZLK4_9AGAM|nr:hypothetical protein PISMIDRAFT_671533 [Pisolithus microcarpus 441]
MKSFPFGIVSHLFALPCGLVTFSAPLEALDTWQIGVWRLPAGVQAHACTYQQHGCMSMCTG